MINDSGFVSKKGKGFSVGHAQMPDIYQYKNNIHNGGGLYHFLKKRLVEKNKFNDESNSSELRMILSALRRFYFIGITSDHDDYLYLCNLLKFKKFYKNQNISHKYVGKNHENKELSDSIFKQFPHDKEIYNQAIL